MTKIGFVQHTVNLFQEFILHLFPQDFFMNSDNTDTYSIFFKAVCEFLLLVVHRQKTAQFFFYHILFKEVAINFIDCLSGNNHDFISFEDHVLCAEKVHLMMNIKNNRSESIC